MDLRANTAVDVLIGPFVDLTNGYAAEEGLTPSVLLSKNGQALAAKNDANACTHDDAGYYNCPLDATDTEAEGQLVLVVEADANALPVRHEYNVMAEAAWDSKYVPKDDGYMDVNVKAVSEDTTASDDLEAFIEALGTDDKVLVSADAQDLSATFDVNTKTITDGAITAAKIAADAITEAKIADNAIAAEHIAADAIDASALAADAVAEINATVDTALGDFFTSSAALVDAIWNEATADHTGAGSASKALIDVLADTNELQGDWANGGRLDLLIDAILEDTGTTLDGIVDSILADTNELQTDLTDGGRLDLILDGILEDTGTTLQGELDGIQADTEDLQTQIGTAGDGLTAITGNTDDLADGERLDLILDAILADTNELQADDTPGALAAIDTKIDTIDDIVDDILVDTGTTLQGELDGIQADTEDLQTQIGTAGDGLTAVIAGSYQLVGSCAYNSGALEVSFALVSGGAVVNATACTALVLYDFDSTSVIAHVDWDTAPTEDGTTHVWYAKKDDASGNISAGHAYYALATLTVGGVSTAYAGLFLATAATS